MSNAPPTPPATTAIEMQDESRDNAPAPVAHPDSYQLAFAEISTLVTQKQWHTVIEFAERSELNGDRQRTMLLVTVPLVLACLIEDELPRAHFALQRLPSSLHSVPLVAELASLLSATSKRHHSLVYSNARALFSQSSQPPPQEAPLYAVVAPMITAFIDAFRFRTFVLLSKAYTSLPLALAESYLGMPDDQLAEALKRYEWSYDPSTKIITPKPLTATVSQGTLSGPSTLAKFDFIASSVVRLEV